MAYAIAEECAENGAEVLIISGPVNISLKNKNIKLISVSTAAEMFEASIMHYPAMDTAILAAAVSDFSPDFPLSNKMKSGKDDLTIKLKPTKDIAAELGKTKKDSQLLIGFALETNKELENAKAKLKKKNFDFIVLNSLRDKGAGFGTDTNKITIIDKNNNIDKFELKSKSEVAHDIIEKMISLI